MTTKAKTPKKVTVDVDDLVGVAEIAYLLSEKYNRHIERSNVTTWIYRRETQSNGFPLQVKQLAMGGLYKWSEIDRWYAIGNGRAA